MPFAAGQKSPEFATPSVLYLHEAGYRGDESFVIETFVGGHDLDTVYPPPNFKNCLREPATDVSSSHVGCDGRRAYPSAYYALWSDVAAKLAVLHKATKTTAPSPTTTTSLSHHACSASAAPSLLGVAQPHSVPKSSFGFGEFNARLNVSNGEDGEHRGVVEDDQFAKRSEGGTIDFSALCPTDYPRYYQCASKTWYAAILEGAEENAEEDAKFYASIDALVEDGHLSGEVLQKALLFVQSEAAKTANSENVCYFLSTVAEAKAFINALYDNVKTFLRTFAEPSLIHCDLTSGNIRVNASPPPVTTDHTGISASCSSVPIALVGFIDFADAKIGDPLYDLGVIMHHLRGDARTWDALREGYLSSFSSSSSSELSSPFPSFSLLESYRILFYAITWLVWRLVDGNKAEEEESLHVELVRLHGIFKGLSAS